MGVFVFGLGYVGSRVASKLESQGWKVGGSVRELEKEDADKEKLHNVEVVVLPRENATVEDMVALLGKYTHFLFTAPVGRNGSDPFLADPVIGNAIVQLAEEGKVDWAGYLSTTSVYGNHDGSWVSEETPLMPSLKRGEMRLMVEQSFLYESGLPMHIFRLPGIYGPGRGIISRLRKGDARCIVKEGQIFSRIHVDDIVGVVLASIASPNPGRAYNVTDDEPEMNHVVTEFAASLMGIPAPPREDFEIAKESMSAMSLSFFSESKRVSNNRIKKELGYTLRYPTYREGLRAQLEEELANGWTIIDPSDPAPYALKTGKRGESNNGEKVTQSAPVVDRRPTASKGHRSEGKRPSLAENVRSGFHWLWKSITARLYSFIGGNGSSFLGWVFQSFVNPIFKFLFRETSPKNSEKRTTFLLIDNGSLKATPCIQLRQHAYNVEKLVRVALFHGEGVIEVLPVSARYSDKIPPAMLEGKSAETIRTYIESVTSDSSENSVADRVIALPYFLGPSSSLTYSFKELRSNLPSHVPVSVADHLWSRDGAIAEILVDMVLQVAQERNLQAPYSVVLVDHGSPLRSVNQVRRALAAQMRRKLGQNARCVVDCSMERRESEEFDFNDPLLEKVFEKGGLENGDVILAMAFLAPGKHAGEGGDIAQILERVTKEKDVIVHQTKLIGDVDMNGDRIARILAQRAIASLRSSL